MSEIMKSAKDLNLGDIFDLMNSPYTKELCHNLGASSSMSTNACVIDVEDVADDCVRVSTDFGTFVCPPNHQLSLVLNEREYEIPEQPYLSAAYKRGEAYGAFKATRSAVEAVLAAGSPDIAKVVAGDYWHLYLEDEPGG